MSTKRSVPNIGLIREAVKASHSWRAVALALGMTYPSCSIYRVIRPLCSQHGIDYTHFTGQASNRGKAFPDKRQNIQLYLTNELPISSHNLKIKLLQEGIKRHQCERCQRTEWNEQPIPIQLHHIDGNSANNLLDNLQILCPNCHAQTENYCAKNLKSQPRQVTESVSDDTLIGFVPLSQNPSQVLRAAGLSLAQAHYNRIERLIGENPSLQFASRPKTKSRNPNADPYWRVKPKPEQRKYVRPSKQDLHRLVWSKSSVQVAKELGICDTLLCRWCRDEEVAKPPRGYWARRAVGLSHKQALSPVVPKITQIQKRLTDEQVVEILSLLKADELSLREIGERYGFRHQTIMEIRDGKSYKHVPRQMVPVADITLHALTGNTV